MYILEPVCWCTHSRKRAVGACFSREFIREEKERDILSNTKRERERERESGLLFLHAFSDCAHPKKLHTRKGARRRKKPPILLHSYVSVSERPLSPPPMHKGEKKDQFVCPLLPSLLLSVLPSSGIIFIETPGLLALSGSVFVSAL